MVGANSEDKKLLERTKSGIAAGKAGRHPGQSTAQESRAIRASLPRRNGRAGGCVWSVLSTAYTVPKKVGTCVAGAETLQNPSMVWKTTSAEVRGRDPLTWCKVVHLYPLEAKLQFITGFEGVH